MAEVAPPGTVAGAGPRSPLLVLASTYPRWRGDPEPAFVHELARRLVDDFEVTAVVPHAPGAAREEWLDGVRVRRFRYAPVRWQTLVNDGGIVANLRRRPWQWLLVPGFLLASCWAARRELRSLRPRVVHAHWLIPQGLIAAALCRGPKAPRLMVTSHGADLYALRSWPLPALKRWVARRASALTVVSAAMADALVALGADPARIEVRPMGVDMHGRFTADAAIPRADEELLFVGRLVEKKGLRYLLEALPRVLEQRPGSRLKIAGFGPEEAALRAQCHALGLDASVDFLGAVPQQELPALYRRATVFVAPFVEAASGDQEGLGLVMIEAAACGCPVVASDLPAVRDVLEERVAPADPAALAAKLLELLGESAQQRASRASRLRAQLEARFDWQPVAAGYARLLRRLDRGAA